VVRLGARERILDAAGGPFYEHGFAAVGIDAFEFTSPSCPRAVTTTLLIRLTAHAGQECVEGLGEMLLPEWLWGQGRSSSMGGFRQLLLVHGSVACSGSVDLDH